MRKIVWLSQIKYNLFRCIYLGQLAIFKVFAQLCLGNLYMISYTFLFLIFIVYLCKHWLFLQVVCYLKQTYLDSAYNSFLVNEYCFKNFG